MRKLAGAAGDYLAAQVRAGAQAVQMFDSWAGRLTADEYRTAVLPFAADALRRATAGGDVPVIHFATQAAHLLPLLREAGGTVFGVGNDIPIDEAWRRLGDGIAVQGNLDPDTLLGPEKEMQRQAEDILARVAGRPGHIFNLAHGVKKETDPARVRALVDFVHGYPSAI
jgi:uroporphyrinogen decarboxylase